MSFRRAVILDAPDSGPLTPAVAIPCQFRMHVLGGPEVTVSGEIEKLVSRRLIARLSAPVAQAAHVRIDCDDAYVLGELLGCWHHGGILFAAIELREQMSGLAQLAAQLDESWAEWR